jgi:hypothetical protein
MAVPLSIRILEVLSSNPYRDTDCPEWDCSGFPVPPEKCRDSISIRSQPLPCHSSVILQFDSMHSYYWGAVEQLTTDKFSAMNTTVLSVFVEDISFIYTSLEQ